MPMRMFSRGSPKLTVSNDNADVAGREPSRPFPLQEVSWNSVANDAKIDLLYTPSSVAKWLSSTPLPDPFFDTQENIATISPDKSIFSLHSNHKTKFNAKDCKARLNNTADVDSSCASLRSSASSTGPQDTLFRNPTSEATGLYMTPHAARNESEPGAVMEIPVARSLKYSQHLSISAGNVSQVGSCTAVVPAAPGPPSNTYSQQHFEIEEDPNFWKDHNVQAVIRVRPLSSSEIATQGHSLCIRQDSAHAITWTGHPESRFTFDLVACETITQEKIFKVAGLPMVENCLAGYNSCMFAYGQTGSGKTFTMLGDLEGGHHRPSENRGMTPRVFEYLFAKIEQEEAARASEHLKFTCKCSFLEIYNEQILDLLEPSNANLQMREDARKGVYVENLSEVEVKNAQDVITLLLQGAANRKVAATNMNRESSRSHSVFTCVIQSKWTTQTVTNSRYGRLNLVDLAGSERQKSSGAEGERLKEAANINKSLSTLGLVIMSLVDIANGKQRHVPYRDSKLTFLLHDSLGGNSKTTIIANISPSNCCALETLGTLKFAQRAKFIRNNAIVNENATGDVLALRLQIQQLKQENSRLRMVSMGGNAACAELLLAEGILGPDSTYQEASSFGSIGHSAYSLEAWDSFRACATPAFDTKKKNGLELALVGALRREQSGEARIRELQSEIEQVKRLVKQREEDSQCGKMMLRFREDKIKRLESLLGGLISADTYLLEEKECLSEEVQTLRTRLERNPEVTRFAMENIRLLEDLRRFQEFYEAGERDVMAEEISILRDQLLEALDWKLMHEQDTKTAGKSQESQQSGSVGEQNLVENEVDQSKLEKQIETVEAVASMQADLIAMREAVVAATNGEIAARECVALLTAEVEGLQRGLKDLQKENARLCDMYQSATTEVENEKLDVQKRFRDLQNDYAQLQSCYDSALSEKEVLSGRLSGDLQLLEERHVNEMQALCSSLHAAEEELEVMKREQEQIQPLKASLDAAQEELARMRGEQQEVQAVKGSLVAAQEELERMREEQKEMQVLKVSVDAAQDLERRKQAEMQALKGSLVAAHEELGRMRSEQKEMQALKCCLDAAQEELQMMKKEQEQMQALKSSLRTAEETLEIMAEEHEERMQHNLVERVPKELADSREMEILQCPLQAAQEFEAAATVTEELPATNERFRKLQEENARLQSMCKAIMIEREDVSQKLNILAISHRQGEEELQELRKSLIAPQGALTCARLKQNEKIVDYSASNWKLKGNDESLAEQQSELPELHKEETVEYSAINWKLKGNDKSLAEQWMEPPKLHKEGAPGRTDVYETVNCDRLLQQVRELQQENAKLQELSRCSVGDHDALLSIIDDKIRCLLRDVERKMEGLDLSLTTFAGELCQDGQTFESSMENLHMQVTSLLEATSLKYEMLKQELFRMTSMLRDAEQAKYDAHHLSIVEKESWMEDVRALQDRLNAALNMSNMKEKVWTESLETSQVKLDLVEAKLSDLSTLVDRAVTGLKNQWEEMKERMIKTVMEILKTKEEIGLIEERQNTAQCKLKQEQSKENALRKMLDAFCASKLDWSCREETMQDHVHVLRGVLGEKEQEVMELKGEEENLRASLDDLLKTEEITELEVAAFEEKLQAMEHWQGDIPGSTTSALSMLQLLRVEEEKATLLSVLAEEHEKLKVIKADIEQLKGFIDKKETAVLCAQVEQEAAAQSLQEAEGALVEVEKENHILTETEAQARAELEGLNSSHLQAELEVQELEVKLQSAQHYLQELKESLLGRAQSCRWEEILNDVHKNQTTLAGMLFESQRGIQNIRCTVESLEK